MDALSQFGGIVVFVAGVVLVLRFIRWGNRYWNTTPGRPDAAARRAAYAHAGIQVDDGFDRQVARGTLQSVPFVLTLYLFGKPPGGVLEVPDARGGDFRIAREADDMRQFLRLGSGHALQSADTGIDFAGMDAALAAGDERQAARALFHLGFDTLERRGGALRAVKFYCPELPELDVMRRALAQLDVLRARFGA